MNTLGRILAATGLAVLVAPGALARAAEAPIWLAPERSPGQPFVVGLLGSDAAARATGASLEELPAAGPVRAFRVRPAGDGTIGLEAGAATARVELGPPGARVEVKAAPATPVKGEDTSARLEIAVLRGDGTPDPEAPFPVLRANVGEVGPAEPLGGGRFSAVYRLPKERYPEVAIVVAFAPWPHAEAVEGAFGAAVIPLASAVRLPGKTEPRARISVEIAGRSFGPVDADPAGAFELPVVVPPGHRFAKSVVTDRLGNRRTKRIDLRLPPTDRIACVANPGSLPADGAARARVICLVTDPYGAPVAGARIAARARLGRLVGPRARGEAYEWEYLAPARAGAADELSFEYAAGGPQSRERIGVELRPLPLATATLAVEPQPVFVGGRAQATLVVADRDGRPVQARPRLAAARGRLEGWTADGPGRLRATYLPPAEEGDWSDRVGGTVLAEPGRVPARLRLSAEGAQLIARAEDLGGAPVEGVRLESDGRLEITDGDGRATFAARSPAGRLEPVSVRAADRPGLRAQAWWIREGEAVHLFPDAGPLPRVALAVGVALAPAAPVDLQLSIGPGGLRARVLDVSGRVLPGRSLSFTAESPGGEVALGEAREEADGSWVVPFAGPVHGALSASASDLASGVSVAEEAILP